MDNQIKTGYPALDKLLGGGLRPGEVTVLSGDDVAATSILSLNILLNNLLRNPYVNAGKGNILLFSVFESPADTVERMVCIEAGYEKHTGTPAETVQKKIADVINQLKETNFYIEEAQTLTINEIVEKATNLKQASGLEFIVIESFQALVRRKPPYHPFGDPEEAVHAATKIKRLAKDWNVPILVLYFPPHRPKFPPDMCGAMLDMGDNIIRLAFDEEAHILKAEVTKSSHGTMGTVDFIYENRWKRIR